jgi:hypothetical protein
LSAFQPPRRYFANQSSQLQNCTGARNYQV